MQGIYLKKCRALAPCNFFTDFGKFSNKKWTLKRQTKQNFSEQNKTDLNFHLAHCGTHEVGVARQCAHILTIIIMLMLITGDITNLHIYYIY